jgi:hypothetical protein
MPLQTPAPGTALALTITAFPITVLHRIHSENFGSAQFNSSGKGNARFSPIIDSSGSIIPTIYAGSTFACALMETAFHDVPYASMPKRFDKSRLKGLRHSVLIATAPLALADLGSISLHRLGIERKQLIDTEADQYSRTRTWAEAIHAQDASVQGLRWTSRQDDGATAIVLFGDRIPSMGIQLQGKQRSLLSDAYMDVLEVAMAIGLDLYDPAL